MSSQPTVTRSRLLALGALLVVPTLLVYLPALRSGFIWDDDSFLTANPLIKAPDGLFRFWCTTQAPDYWPMSSTTLWFEWRLWGMHAAGYHATNLLLHCGEVILLWGILRRLRIPGAWLGALLFALHPVNVESVAWITQRKNLMALLFIELCVLCFLQEEGIRGPERTARPGSGGFPKGPAWYLAGLTAYALALLSKGSAVILPGVLLGIVAWRRPVTLRDILRLVPHGVLAVSFTGINVWFQHHHSASDYVRPDGPLARLLGAGAVVWFYLWKAVIPARLLFVYPLWRIRTDEFLWWLPLLAAATLTGVLWRGRRTWSRPLLFAWLYFCAALLPVMGFTDVHFMQYSLVSDHYQHLALIAICAGTAAAWTRACRQPAAIARTAAGWTAACIACTLAGLTWHQQRIYHDRETLFRETIAANPACWMAHNNLGLMLEDRGRMEDAIAEYGQALHYNPGDYRINVNLGVVLLQTGRVDEAIGQDRAAIRIRPDSPEAHTNLGNALVRDGRLSEAVAQYREALRLEPGFSNASRNLAFVEARLGSRPP